MPIIFTVTYLTHLTSKYRNSLQLLWAILGLFFCGCVTCNTKCLLPRFTLQIGSSWSGARGCTAAARRGRKWRPWPTAIHGSPDARVVPDCMAVARTSAEQSDVAALCFVKSTLMYLDVPRVLKEWVPRDTKSKDLQRNSMAMKSQWQSFWRHGNDWPWQVRTERERRAAEKNYLEDMSP